MTAMIAEKNVAIATTTTAEIDPPVLGLVVAWLSPGCRMFVLIYCLKTIATLANYICKGFIKLTSGVGR